MGFEVVEESSQFGAGVAGQFVSVVELGLIDVGLVEREVELALDFGAGAS